jgi:hypothetical protein
LVALLVGASVGGILVIETLATQVSPLRLSVTLDGSGNNSALSCNHNPGVCDNVTIGFTGLAFLDPAILRISIVPENGSEVVNATAGVPMNLAYLADAIPAWMGQTGPGNYSEPPSGMIMDPGGHYVGSGGETRIYPGAVLCLEYYPSTPTAFYFLAFEYGGTNARVLIGFG